MVKIDEGERLAYSCSLTTHSYTFIRQNDTTYACMVSGVKGAAQFHSLALTLSVYGRVKRVDINRHTIEFTITEKPNKPISFLSYLAHRMDRVLNVYKEDGVAQAIRLALDRFGFYDCDDEDVVNTIYNLLVLDANLTLDDIVGDIVKEEFKWNQS